MRNELIPFEKSIDTIIGACLRVDRPDVALRLIQDPVKYLIVPPPKTILALLYRLCFDAKTTPECLTKVWDVSALYKKFGYGPTPTYCRILLRAAALENNSARIEEIVKQAKFEMSKADDNVRNSFLLELQRFYLSIKDYEKSLEHGQAITGADGKQNVFMALMALRRYDDAVAILDSLEMTDSFKGLLTKRRVVECCEHLMLKTKLSSMMQ